MQYSKRGQRMNWLSRGFRRKPAGAHVIEEPYTIIPRRVLLCALSIALVVSSVPSISFAWRKDGIDVTFTTSQEAACTEEDSENPGHKFNYFDGEVTVQASIAKADFDADKVKVTTDGESGSWTLSDDTGSYIYSSVFNTAGVKKLVVTLLDNVGDTSGEDYTYTAVIDNTAPNISISSDQQLTSTDDEGTKFYPAGTKFDISIDESNLDSDSVKVTLDDEEQTSLDWNDGKTQISAPSDEYTKHTLTVSAKDKSGNESSESLIFAIDADEYIVSYDFSKEPVFKDSSSVYFNSDDVVATVKVQKAHLDTNKSSVTTDATQKEGWTQDPTDPNKTTWYSTYSLDAEQEYSFKTKVVLQSGKSIIDEYDKTVVVDKTNPTVNVSFDKNLIATKDGVDYFNDCPVATIVAKDQHFSTDNSKVLVNGNEKGVTWQKTDDGYKATVTLEEGHDQAITVRAKDKAGNECAYQYGSNTQDSTSTKDAKGTSLTGTKFTVDTTSPDVEVTLDQEHKAKFKGVDYFNNLSGDATEGAKELTATVVVKDVDFDADNTQITGNGTTWTSSWVKGDIDDKGITTWTTTITYKESANNTIELCAIDLAKNKSTYKYGNNGTAPDKAKSGGNLSTKDKNDKDIDGTSFTVDLTAPTISDANIAIRRINEYNKQNIQFWNSNVALTVTIKDSIGLQTISLGNSDQHYYIENNVEVGAKEHSITVYLNDGYEFNRDIILSSKDVAQNVRTWNISPNGTVIDVTKSSNSNTSINNEDIYPTNLVKDTLAPVLSFSGANEGEYYTGSKSVVLDVDELNFRYLKTYEPDQTIITVNKVSGDASAGQSSWTDPVSYFGGDPNLGKYNYTETFAEDGHYSLSAKVVDPAKNVGTAELGTFTIDNTAPTVSVSFDNNNYQNGKYFNAARTATVVITEHNFDPSLISIDTTGQIGSWTSNGDEHTITIRYTTGGVYNLSISGQDLAGNALGGYTSGEFVIDLTPPTIMFVGVENNHAYNGTVEPQIMFFDEANFNSNGMSYTLSGTKNGVVSYSLSTSAEANGQIVKYANFIHDSDHDDIYTINATLQDLAGNSATNSITFSVNRYGSNFRIVDEQAYKTNNGYLTQPQDIILEEINVSGCESQNHGVTITRGVSTETLTLNETPQTTGYSIAEATSSEGDSNGWSLYTYTVSSGNFKQDGNYYVSADSQDRATNTNDSSEYYNRSSKELSNASVQFILDTTDPIISGLNIEDGATYDQELLQASFSVIENIGIQDVQATLDNQAVELNREANDTYTFEVPAQSFTGRNLQINATDYAGRVGSANIGGFHVTTNVLELHLPWVIAGAIIVLGAIGTIIFFIIKRRKQDEDEEEDEEEALQ